MAGENDLWLLNPDTKGLRRLTHDGVVKEVPTFSPSGDRIAFIKQHDLYVVDVATGVMRRLTHDGSDTIYNGLLDWVMVRSSPIAPPRAPMSGRRMASKSRTCGWMTAPCLNIPSPISIRRTSL